MKGVIFVPAGGYFVIPHKYSLSFDEEAKLQNTEVIVSRVTDFDVIDMHTHEFIEIAYVHAGSGWHVLGDDIRRCGPGSVYVINVEDAHMFMSDDESPLTIYNLIFRPGFFDVTLLGRQSFADVARHFLLRTFQYDGFSHSLGVTFNEDELADISRLLGRMLDEYQRHEPGFVELIRSWTIELLVYIFRKLRAAEDFSAETAGMKADVFDHVFEYIRCNYAEPISLEKLSMLAFLSPKYFSKLFKAHTGCTVTEYTQRLRIARACELLRDTDMTVAEIAEQTGYSDIKYFNRVFRRHMNMPPAEYRRQK